MKSKGRLLGREMSAAGVAGFLFPFAMDCMEDHLESFDDPGAGACHKVGIKQYHVVGLNGR